MTAIILTESAHNDLTRLRDFLLDQDAEVAGNVGKAIAAHISRLKRYPESAPLVHERYRLLSIPFGKRGYSAAYTYTAETDVVLILGIKHQKEAFFPFELTPCPDSDGEENILPE